MAELLPFDLTEIIHAELEGARRAPDGLLHPSTHLAGPLRHAMLNAAGAPENRNPLTTEVALMTGTLWHQWIGDTLTRLGLPVMLEVKLDPWLPAGWAGTADIVAWNPQLKSWVLVDIKTTKGEGIRYIEQKGAKDEHILQASSYWHALRKMGLPLAKKIGVYYLPKNGVSGRDVRPILVDFDPVPVRELNAVMKGRGKSVTKYLESLPERPFAPEPDEYDFWVTPELAPVDEREQRLFPDRASGTSEVRLVPHWTAAFCPFPDELCDCSTLGQTKIGTYDFDGTYIPRTGYADIEPTVQPAYVP